MDEHRGSLSDAKYNYLSINNKQSFIRPPVFNSNIYSEDEMRSLPNYSGLSNIDRGDIQIQIAPQKQRTDQGKQLHTSPFRYESVQNMQKPITDPQSRNYAGLNMSYSIKGNDDERKSYNPVDVSYMRVITTLLEYVQETFPSSINQLKLMSSTADAKEFLMRTLANTFRQAISKLNSQDSIEFWKKLHPLFQLRIEAISPQIGKKAEALEISDIHAQLFRLETMIQREFETIDQAMQKLEKSKKETQQKINLLLKQANTVQADDDDSLLLETNIDLKTNVEQIKKSNLTLEREMQSKKVKLVDRQRTLAYFKQRFVEDLDFTIKSEIKNITDFVQQSADPRVSISPPPNLKNNQTILNQQHSPKKQDQQASPTKKRAPEIKTYNDQNEKQKALQLIHDDTSNAGDSLLSYSDGMRNRRQSSTSMKNQPNSIKLDFKPQYIKQIGGVWLLVADANTSAYIYAATTLRLAKQLNAESKVICATSSKYLLFLSTANRQILSFNMRDWNLENRVNTLHASTAMDVLADRILIYGLGDDGYGCVFFKEEFRQYERAAQKRETQEPDSKPIAKTCLIVNLRKDGFVCKTGGYTTAHDKKKTACWVTSQSKVETGTFQKLHMKQKSCHLLGEIDDDIWLVYSQSDHSFAIWNSATNQWRSVNLIARKTLVSSIDNSQQQPVLPNLINLKSIRLHPGAYKNSFPYLIMVDKQDKVIIRKFEIIEGYSPPIALDEQKPGLSTFDLNWTKEGSIITYNLKVSELGTKSQADQSSDNFQYEIVKEEYPDELIRAFDII